MHGQGLEEATPHLLKVLLATVKAGKVAWLGHNTTHPPKDETAGQLPLR